MTFAPLFPVYTGFSGCPVSEHSHRQVTAPQGRDEVTGEELRYRNRPLCQQQLLCASGPHTDGDTQTSGWAVGTDNTNDKDDDDGVCVCVCVRSDTTYPGTPHILCHFLKVDGYGHRVNTKGATGGDSSSGHPEWMR